MKSTKDIFTKLRLSSEKYENYFDIYDTILPKYLGKHPHIMEIGVGGGGSIEMWLKYFNNAVTVYALDGDKSTLDNKFDNADIRYSCVDQGSDEHWDAYLKDNPKFDIIIDDGSHKMDHQVLSLNKLFKHLNDNGVYIVENVCTSYWPEYGGGFKKQSTFIEYVKNIIDLLNAPHVPGAKPPKELTAMFPNLKSATFYDNLVVIEKGTTKSSTLLKSKDFKNPTFEWG